MGIKTAQKRHARPMIARFGGSHMVDLAVDPDVATRGMTEDYAYESENGDKVTSYSPPANRRPPYAEFGGGAGDIVVTESPTYDDEAYRINDVQSEPSESDGEDQNMGGRSQPSGAFGNPRYTRRTGGIG